MGKRYARIANGVVAELLELPDGTPPEAAFHPDIAAVLVPCDEPAVAEGWTWEDRAFAAPAPSSVAEARHASLRRAETRRDQALRGVEFEGKVYDIATAAARADLALLGAAAGASLADPQGVPWPADFEIADADGSGAPLTARQMRDLALAAAMHVAGARAAHRKTKGRIAAAASRQALDRIDVGEGYKPAPGQDQRRKSGA